jgi:hypothetical protein
MCGAAMNMKCAFLVFFLSTQWTRSSMHEMDCSTMLAGRAFQGVGSGVILSLVEIVLSDLVPLSERYAPTSPAITLHSI